MTAPTTAPTTDQTTDQTTDLLTIRQMCDAFDVTPRTLRFYEAKELIRPVRDGMKRLYARSDRARLKLILRGKRFGFSLEDIRQTLDLYDRQGSNLAQMERTYALAQDRLAIMEAQRAELDEAIAELQAELRAGAAVIAEVKKAGGAAAA
ncbi:MerR family DNA-binding transcriptional regulator [Rhodobacter sp. Har01]|uniref:MerR family transcriptional regulator n=1 Tax=Rhodobacter sp. Har01 TaxID=2883999 RepID=UPI001D07A779|nr:MerR family DNA-binding transcriptional regulator [Rhodobacter sp. Har01]MCB6179245.1 MerR family DNA-binding transcriptional regulator [Rhodobacter sp. Har01]